MKIKKMGFIQISNILLFLKKKNKQMGLHKSTKSSKLWSELGKWVFKTLLLLARYESITMKNSLSNSPLKRLSLSLMQKL